MNRVQLRGRVVAAPEVLRDKSNATVGVAFRLATGIIANDAQGRPRELREFHRVCAFGESAKGIELARGVAVEVTGGLRPRTRRGQDGRMRDATAVHASRLAASPRATEDMNRVRLIGRLAYDPKVGEKVVRLRLITNYSYSAEDGAVREFADGHNVVAFGRAAEMAKAFKKGDWVEVAGFLRTDRYTDNAGAKRSMVQVVAHKVVVGPEAKADAARPDSAKSPHAELSEAEKSAGQSVGS